MRCAVVSCMLLQLHILLHLRLLIPRLSLCHEFTIRRTFRQPPKKAARNEPPQHFAAQQQQLSEVLTEPKNRCTCKPFAQLVKKISILRGC